MYVKTRTPTETKKGIFPTLKEACESEDLDYGKVKKALFRLGLTKNQVFGIGPRPCCPNCGELPPIGRTFCTRGCQGSYDRKQSNPLSLETKKSIADNKYKNWYYKFIAGWRSDSDAWLKIEKNHREYREKHHIIPRCMGGTDHPDNLIYLTPEKHFFVHILLAKAYGNEDLWNAVRLLMPQKGEHYSRRMRILYGIVRREAIIAASGEANPNADKNLYYWINSNGDREHCTRCEMKEKYNLTDQDIFGIISKRIFCSKGWTLESRLDEPGFSFNRKSGDDHYKTDKTIRLWRHKDGREFKGTNSQLKDYDSAVKRPDKVVCLVNKTDHGWYLTEQYEVFPEPKEFTNCDETIRLWRHKNGDEFKGTNIELKKYDPNVTRLDMVVNRKNKTANGWFLVEQYDYFPERPESLHAVSFELITLKNINGEKIIGKRIELQKSLGIKSGEMTNLLSGKIKNTHGWMLSDTDPNKAKFFSK